MSNSGTLMLSNSEYVQNQAKFYSSLLEKQELSDVTLACDGFKVWGHRTILAASSLFFRDVIINSKHQNPFIYLKGINKELLESLIKFIYIGEATVQTDKLERFVELGNELQIIGLMEEDSFEKNYEIKNNLNQKKSQSKKSRKKASESTKAENGSDSLKVEEIEGSVSMEQVQKLMHKKLASWTWNSGDLATEVKKRMSTKFDEHGRIHHICAVCKTESKTTTKLREHIETHLEGFSHECQICGKSKKTTSALNQHVQKYHINANEVVDKSGKKANSEDNVLE